MILIYSIKSHGVRPTRDWQQSHLPSGLEGVTMQNENLLNEVVETEALAHLSASHSNALVENPFD